MQKYVFLSNIYDHRLPSGEMYFIYSFDTYQNPELKKQEWQNHLDWINRFVISRPKSTPSYTVKQLENMEMIGIYCPIEKYDWREPNEDDIVEF